MNLRLLSLLAVVLLTLSACAGSISDQTKTKFRIGVILPLSGPVAQCGEDGVLGLELALDSLQLRDKVELVYEDDKFIPKESVTAMQKLVSEGYKVIIGTCNSSGSLAIAPIAEANKRLMITPMSGADPLSESGDYIFRMAPKTSVEGVTMARFVKAKGYKRVAFFYMNNDYGKGYLDAFAQEIAGSDVKLVAKIAVDITGTDFRTEVTKLKQASPDIIAAVPVPAQGAILMRQLAEQGVTTQKIIGRPMEYKEVVDAAGPTLEGTYLVTGNYGLNKRFQQEFLASKTQRLSSDQVLGAYDTIYALNYALTQCGNDQPDCLKTALYNIKGVVGSRGEIKIDAKGDVVVQMIVKQFQGGKFVEL